MILDALNLFSDAQTTTTGTGSGSAPGVRSTNIIDLRTAVSRLGVGENLYLVVQLTTGLASSGSNDAMDVNLYTDADENFGSPTLVQKIGTFAAVSVAGTRIIARLNPLALERYIGLYYLSQTSDAFSAGAVTAFLTHDIDAFTAYPDAITIQ